MIDALSNGRYRGSRAVSIVKWGGVVVCAALVVVWGLSWRWYVNYEGWSGYRFTVEGGCAVIWTTRRPSRSLFEWDFGEHWPGFSWSYAVRTMGGNRVTVVPLWMPLVPVLLATGAAWSMDAVARRRARAGLCRKCGYDLRGLSDGAVCPECGVADQRE